MGKHRGLIIAVCTLISLAGCSNYWHRQAQLGVCDQASDPQQCEARVRSGELKNLRDVPEQEVVLTDEELLKRAEKAREKSGEKH